MFKYVLTLVAIATLAACSPAEFKEAVLKEQAKANRIHLSSVAPDGSIVNCTPGIPSGSADSDSDSDSNSSDSDSSDSNSSDSTSSDSDSSDSSSCSHGGKSKTQLPACTDVNLNCLCDEVETPSTPGPGASEL